jgi:hypothetical protein
VRFLALIIVLVANTSISGPTRAESSGYLSALNYRKYTCQQLTAEAQAIALRAQEFAQKPSGVRKSTDDRKTATIVISWPDLSLHALDKTLIANIKNQIQMIEEATIEKQCSIQFEISNEQNKAR